MNCIAVDAMGGDHAPGPELEGAVRAAREAQVEVLLVGPAKRLEESLVGVEADVRERISIANATEVVTMDDHPGKAFRKKPDSSLRVAVAAVKSGRAQGVVSAGNSGAVLAHSLFLLGRLPGVERPAIVTTFPTPTGTLVLCDMGANVDVKPTMLAQFAVLGAHYDRVVHKRERPVVGLLSNGTESHKGTDLTRQADEILQRVAEHPDAVLSYAGYVEGSDLFRGQIDVVATDGFTGNVVLKLSEGVSEAVLKMIKRALDSSVRSKLGALLARPALLELRESIHYSQVGGAVLLGIDGLATICHGRSDAVAIKNAIIATDRFAQERLTPEIAAAIERHKGLWDTQSGEGAVTESA